MTSPREHHAWQAPAATDAATNAPVRHFQDRKASLACAPGDNPFASLSLPEVARRGSLAPLASLAEQRRASLRPGSERKASLVAGLGPGSLAEAGADPRTIAARRRQSVVSTQYEVLLQELLSAAGVLGAGDGLPNVSERRLAAHVALLRHLLASTAFGALQGVMTSIAGELLRCVYSDQPAAAPGLPAAQLAAQVGELPRAPYFLLAQAAQQEAQQLREECTSLRSSTSCAQTASPEAEPAPALAEQAAQECEQLRSTVAGLEAQLRAAQAQAAAGAEQVAQVAAQLQQERRRHQVQLAEERQGAEEAQRELAWLAAHAPANGRQVADPLLAALQAASQPPADQAATDPADTCCTVLEAQISVLLSARIDAHEAAAHAARAAELPALCDSLAAEAAPLVAHLQALRGTAPDACSAAHAGSAEQPAASRDSDAASTSGREDEDYGTPMWAHFRLLAGPTFPMPRRQWSRRLEVEALVARIEAFLAARWRAASPARRRRSSAPYEPCLTALWRQAEAQYGDSDVTAFILHGWLTSAERHAEGHAVVDLFVRMLNEACPDLLWQYTMHWRSLLEALPSPPPHTPARIAATLYPGASQAEHMQVLGALGDSALGVGQAVRCLTGLLLAGGEPRLARWSQVLCTRAGARAGLLQPEFAEALQTRLPAVGTDACLAMFSAAASQHGGVRLVPVPALAAAACCLEASQVEAEKHDDTS